MENGRRYLVVPTNPEAPERRLRFFREGELIQDLVARVDLVDPTCEFTVDVTPYAGDGLEVTCDGEPIELREVDAKPAERDGKERPLAHFTAREGWLNDPNGLTCVDGRYLMFFQHNPAGVEWGNLHWGRAGSSDLIHWREGEILFFPDERGAAYSGSAFIDRANASGLKEGDDDPILLFYTRAGGAGELSEGVGFTQNLAYSVDGGVTFREYEGNPILEEIHPGNRDPKVIASPEPGRYLMVLYLGKRWFGLFGSNDLLHWEELQRWQMEGDAECPDLYPLPLDGDPGDVRWVFSAASDHYLVGHLEDERFVADGNERSLNYGNASYAAQSWSDLPDGRRVRTAFAKLMVPGERWACCLNLPQEMTLRTVAGIPRLSANPAPEVALLHTDEHTFERLALPTEIPVSSRCIDLRLAMPEDASWTLSFRGLDVRYDAPERTLTCGDSRAPVHGLDGIVELRALIDTCYAELFCDGGSVFLGMIYTPDEASTSVKITSDSEAWTLDVAEMAPYWTD